MALDTGSITYWHNKKLNYLFLDGHVELVHDAPHWLAIRGSVASPYQGNYRDGTTWKSYGILEFMRQYK